MRENFILYPSYQGPPPQQQGENVTADKWIYQWREPVRFKRIHVSVIASGGVWDHSQPLPPLSLWFRSLSEPVMVKARLPAALNPFPASIVIQPPGAATLIQGWYTWLSEPQRFKQGLSARFQQTLAYHPRHLPTPNVFVTMDATETNNDVALFGVNVTSGSTPTTGQPGALVTITEIPAQGDALMSIREP